MDHGPAPDGATDGRVWDEKNNTQPGRRPRSCDIIPPVTAKAGILNPYGVVAWVGLGLVFYFLLGGPAAVPRCDGSEPGHSSRNATTPSGKCNRAHENPTTLLLVASDLGPRGRRERDTTGKPGPGLLLVVTCPGDVWRLSVAVSTNKLRLFDIAIDVLALGAGAALLSRAPFPAEQLRSIPPFAALALLLIENPFPKRAPKSTRWMSLSALHSPSSFSSSFSTPCPLLDPQLLVLTSKESEYSTV